MCSVREVIVLLINMRTSFLTTNDEHKRIVKNFAFLNVVQRSQGKKIIQKQTSILDYFIKRNDTAEHVDKIESGSELMMTVNVQKLINQLTSAKVILKRLPDSLLIKYNKFNYDRIEMKLLYCPECKMIVKTKKGCSEKCNKCESYVQFECAKCGARYSSPSSIRYHLTTKCFCKTSYRCSECEYSSPVKRNLDSHMRLVHTVHTDRRKLTLFRCRNCKGHFPYRWEYIKHKEVCNSRNRN